MQIADHISELIGNTPLVRLNAVVPSGSALVAAKVEYLNPGGSIKDRIAKKMVDAAEAEGLLKPGGTIVEPTSGNTGVGLALVAQQRGYKCIFVCPDKVGQDKIDVLRAYGAEVRVTPTAVAPEHPDSYYSVSDRLAAETPGGWKPNQYENPNGPASHYESTGPESWAQTGGRIDALVSAMGTGGTISGCGQYLKEQDPKVKIVGVDPVGSLYYDYFKTGKMTEAYTYKVEGFGEDFLPSTMNFDFVDEVVRVTDKECFDVTRRLVREEGIYAGGSSGGAVAGAIKYAERIGKPIDIVVIICDSASRYLSKIFNDEWMREHGFLGNELESGTVADLLANKGSVKVITARIDTPVREVVETMKAKGISQLPVLDGERVVGIINETDLLQYLLSQDVDYGSPIEPLVKATFAIVEPANRVSLISQFFTQGRVVIVMDDQKLVGIVTKIDFIDYMSRVL